jgi:hypothetical protein
MMSGAAAIGVSSRPFDSFASTRRGYGRENPVIQSMCRKITCSKRGAEIEPSLIARSDHKDNE